MAKRTATKKAAGKPAKAPAKPIDPYAPERLDDELQGLLSAILRHEPCRLPQFVDATGCKLFAINLARVLSHRQISAEKAAALLRTDLSTILRWLNAHGKRTSNAVANLGRHLGLSPTTLADRVLSFVEVERLTLGDGWLPRRGWNQDRKRPTAYTAPEAAVGDTDDDDSADWWKRGAPA